MTIIMIRASPKTTRAEPSLLSAAVSALLFSAVLQKWTVKQF